MGIQAQADFFNVKTIKQDIRAKYIVNAAGVHADKILNMAGEREFSIFASRGEYFMLDKNNGTHVNSVVFQCPSKVGKGVLVSPTVHGNLIVGPNAQDIKDGDDVATTRKGLDFVWETAKKSVPELDQRVMIRNFAGVRAHSDQPDFIIKMADSVKRFVNLAGIQSPGLSAAPAIAKMCVGILKEDGLKMSAKESYTQTRSVVRINEMSAQEKNEAIKNNPLYGRVICRCEGITEGEIVDALRRPVQAVSVDGVKKRCNAGMGRCQSGFCGPKVAEIISRELKIPMEKVLMGKEGTYILTGETK